MISIGCRFLVSGALGSGLLLACAPAPRTLPPLGSGGASSAGWTGSWGDIVLLDGGGASGPPAVDAGGICGHHTETIDADHPTVYFVLDASGSMLAPMGALSRYQVVQHAAWMIVDKLHLLIRAGATVFPGASDPDACAPGVEVFPPTLDDAYGFNVATQLIVPSGGTPLATTLQALQPGLASLPGTKLVVLATDGGPNCNAWASCDKSQCIENIEGCASGETCCAQGLNCCAPNATAGPTACVDRDAAVQAVATLASAGIRVVVIGIPGSDPYEQVLRDMALAGGAPFMAYPFYYKASDASSLVAILAFAAGSAIPCTFKLEQPPVDPTLTNVYFDQNLLLFDPNDGWSWSAPDVVQIHGEACAMLKSASVAHVQIVSGCPTAVPQ